MDIEKTMEFIVEHLAHASARVDEVSVKLNKLAEVQVLQAQVLDRHENRLNKMTDILGQVTEKLGQITERQLRAEQETQQLREAIQAQEAAGRHTDERLNALIKVVDDLIRSNGRRRPKKKG